MHAGPLRLPPLSDKSRLLIYYISIKKKEGGGCVWSMFVYSEPLRPLVSNLILVLPSCKSTGANCM